jgi:hypothetical protein
MSCTRFFTGDALPVGLDQWNHQSLQRREQWKHEDGQQNRIDFPFIPDEKIYGV